MDLSLLEALRQLIDLPLTRILSAGTMPMFSFGTLKIAPSPRGGTRKIGTFELHVQCPWRLILNSIVAGSGDYYADAGDESSAEPNHFIDDGIQRLFLTMSPDDLTVRETEVDHLGSFKIIFCNGVIFESFPAASHETEYWRIFKPGDDASHVVCEKILRIE